MIQFGNGFITILFLAVIWIYSIYAGLISKKNKVKEAFASIDVYLKKRYDLMPNILKIAQKYMDYEKNLIEEVVKLRNKAQNIGADFQNIDEKIKLDELISNKMNKIMVAVENYPQLKSSETMIVAMNTYNDVEENIAAARRFYNSAVLDLKNAIEIFPSSIFANMLNIKPTEFFKIEEKERKNVNASDYLK